MTDPEAAWSVQNLIFDRPDNAFYRRLLILQLIMTLTACTRNCPTLAAQ